ncbi:MAG: zinc-ribbon domain-containing protein [Proteobacteria bacterium]|nr:zinc-ribbon domain-containing protein [Pseudomonadota bacterium]
MKIVCDACQAKYSISDDKVQGKVFKIRCKKCSNIIVVRGGANAAEAAPEAKDTRVYDYGYEGGAQAPAGDESVWHVVINQEQVGPMTAAEVQQKFAGGEIDGETFAWREGFADWLPLAQVDAFAAFVASGSTTAAVSPGTSGGVAAMFGGAGASDESGTMRSDPGDLFAAASGGAGAAEDDGGDLFGSKPKATVRTPEPAAASGAAANSKLRGERNENSVLFSLGNLAQLASDRPAPASSSSSSSSGMAGGATGAAGGEGSGLIDIRSMASAYLGPAGGAGSSKPSASAAIGSIDDLPVFGGGGFSDPVALVPQARAAGNNKMMFILIGSVGVLAVAAIIMVVVMMKGGKSDGDKAADKVALADSDKDKDKAGDKEKDKDKDAAKDPPAKDPATDPAKTDTKPAEDPPKTDPAKTETPKADPPKTEPKKADPKTTTKVEPKTTTKVEPKTTTTAKVEPKKPDAGGCDQVSCVVSGYADACCAKYKKPGTTTTDTKPKGDLPDALDRDMIQKGVGSVKARVMTCGDKSSSKGVVKVSVKVGGDGRVAGVTVKESPDPALGSCVANGMKSATFAKTNNGGTFSIPFSF